MKKVAHEAFKKITPQIVQNCIDHVEEQENYYRWLHNLQPLPVENLDSESSNADINLETGSVSLTFTEEGEILTTLEESEKEEIMITPVAIPLHTCSFCNFSTKYISQYKGSFNNYVNS